jgi:hypothetical protein
MMVRAPNPDTDELTPLSVTLGGFSSERPRGTQSGYLIKMMSKIAAFVRAL